MTPSMNPPQDCDCCTGTKIATPRSVANPPGQTALAYRVGTHDEFLSTMKARLGGLPLDCGPDPPLAKLTTRASDDPAVALLDAWALVAEVLTFYQERIANEGFLPTASEDRSIRELARLVDYRPKPGAAAAVDLALTLESDARIPLEPGLSARSTPSANESAQVFETVERVEVRGAWSLLPPLTARLQTFVNSGYGKELTDRSLYIKGITANLKPNDPLLLLFDNRPHEVWRVTESSSNPNAGYTTARIELWRKIAPSEGGVVQEMVLNALGTYLDPNLSPALGLTHGSWLPDDLKHALSAIDPESPREPGVPDPTTDALASLIDFQTLISRGECPPFDQLIDDLRNALAPGSADPAVAIAQAFKGYRATFLPEVSERRLADDLAAVLRSPEASPATDTPTPIDEAGYFYLGLALVSEKRIEALRIALKPNDSDQAHSKAFRDQLNNIIGDLRTLQRLATEAGFGPLAARLAAESDVIANINKLNDTALTAYLGDDQQKNASLSALRAAAAQAPIFKNVLDQLSQLRTRLNTGGIRDADTVALAIVPVFPGLLHGVGVNRDVGPLKKVLDTLADTLDQGATAIFNQAKGLVDRSDNELASRIVSRIVDAVRRYEETLLKKANGTEETVVEDAITHLDTNGIKALFNQLRSDAVNRKINAPAREALLDVDPSDETASAEVVRRLLLWAARARAGASMTAAVRQESALFDGGSFPRIAAWFKDLVGDLERFLEVVPLRFDPAGELAKSAAKVNLHTANSDSNLARVVGFFNEAIDDPTAAGVLDQFYVQLVQSLAGTAPQPLPPPPTLKDLFEPTKAAPVQLVQALNPALEGSFVSAVARADVGRTEALPRAAVLRASAAPFGASAPLQTVTVGFDGNKGPILATREWPLAPVLFTLRFLNPPTVAIPAVDLALGPPGAVVARTIPLKGPEDVSERFGDFTVKVNSPGHSQMTLTLARPGVTETVTVGLPDANLRVTFTDRNSTTYTTSLGAGTETTLTTADGQFTLVRSPQAGSAGPDVVEINGEFDLPSTAAQRRVLSLDAVYDKVAPGSYVAIDRADQPGGFDRPIVARVEAVETVSEAAFGISGKVTRLTLDTEWLGADAISLAAVRGTSVLVQSDLLELADEPYDGDVQGQSIMLDTVAEGLEANHALIVEGERTDLPGTRGVRVAERVAVADIRQGIEAGGEGGSESPPRTTARPHTTLLLRTPLRYTYKRDGARIYGNVVQATHGQTQREVLGGGAPAGQGLALPLKQRPLTFIADVSEEDPLGVKAALEVRVNNVLWHEVRSLHNAGPGDRAYTVRVDERGVATVKFGDGRHGARPPTGTDNIRAVYRTGLGVAGNVGAGKINQLAARPLGIKDVVNPIAAVGAFDPEPPDQARRNLAAGTVALQRLVSAADFADFARGYAGIAKARSDTFNAAGSRRVVLTVAGVGDTSFTGTPLLDGLSRAVIDFGDPTVAVDVVPRRLGLIVLEARLRIDPDADWATVEADARARLLALLGFDAREPGEDVWVGPIVATIQGVDGVRSVEVTALGTVSDHDPTSGGALTPSVVSQAVTAIYEKKPDGAVGRGIDPDGRVCAAAAQAEPEPLGAELVYLTPKVPATLNLIREEAP